MITRVLSQELASGPSPIRVNAPGSSADESEIWVQILRLDGTPGHSVHLAADWRIAPSRKDNAEIHSFSTEVHSSAHSMDSLVQAHEQAIQELAAELLKSLSRR
jgi:uncharacterized lipoprotein YmbA